MYLGVQHRGIGVSDGINERYFHTTNGWYVSFIPLQKVIYGSRTGLQNVDFSRINGSCLKSTTYDDRKGGLGDLTFA